MKMFIKFLFDNGTNPSLSLHLLKKGKEGFAVILLVLASFL